ncbi:MAG TPA: DNA polymerase III subunit delta' [Rickettsiales bacterium]|nr:DNA polymerase III subunit delta' [Rickettsiales bacterium]
MARTATQETEEEVLALHPKYGDHVIGHKAQEQQLLGLIHAKRLPHALLITGQKGIGKATLAYRLAKFLLAYREDAGGGLFGDALPPPESLHIAPDHPTARRVMSGSHPDLLVLEGDDIKIDQIRRVPEFLSYTPAESEWRVVIIDSAEAMNRNSANALLKTLEEPPSQAVILLISHNPGALLPTIRSRCRVLRISALDAQGFADVMRRSAPQIDEGNYGKWALLSGTSPGVALELVQGRADELYEEVVRLLSGADTLKLHAFAERFARKDAEAEWQILKRLVLWLIVRMAALDNGLAGEVFSGEREALEGLRASKPGYFWTEMWERAGNLFGETEHLYLDRKQAVITLFRLFL